MAKRRARAANHCLARGVTVAKYQRMEESRDIAGITEFLRRRFLERYICPATTREKHGFTMMAVACLMIEALESFYQGWPDTNGKSKKAFCKFLDRNSNFHLPKGGSEAFYKNVRCGILHQAETTGGWRIRRNGDLFDPKSKVINATRFLHEMKKSLEGYCNELRGADWNSRIWKNFRKKMKAICDNCGNS